MSKTSPTNTELVYKIIKQIVGVDKEALIKTDKIEKLSIARSYATALMYEVGMSTKQISKEMKRTVPAITIRMQLHKFNMSDRSHDEGYKSNYNLCKNKLRLKTNGIEDIDVDECIACLNQIRQFLIAINK